MKVTEEFKLSTKRFFYFYEFEKMWMVLTVINIIAVFMIIRGSTAPLICSNKVLEFLFCTEVDADKTLYNVSISYLAAYIFYLIQIYCPERKKTKNALLSVRPSVRNLILWVSRFLFVWDIYKQEDDKQEYILTAKVRTIYLKDTKGFVYKVDRSVFGEMVTRIHKEYEEIISNVAFQNCDYALRRLLLEKNIGEYIARLYEQIIEAETLGTSGTIKIGYSPQNVKQMKIKMDFLRKIFDLSVDVDIHITTDKKDINKIENRDKKIMEMLLENKGFFDVLEQKVEKQRE